MKVIYFVFISLIIMLFIGLSTNAQVIQINQTFSADTVFAPFSGSTPVYSLNMSGSVNLYSDSSLIRVILIDVYGNHHLVFESYPMITYGNAFDTLNACDETKYLDGIICDSLRIDIISAFLDLDSLILDTNYISGIKQLQAQAKWISDSLKIHVMNQRIAGEHMYWKAGRTSVVEMTFPEKERHFGSDKFYCEGFDYYKGGIFEFLSIRDSSKSSSAYVDRFDWRNRHGANNASSPYFNGSPSPYYDGDTCGTGWLTEAKDQPSAVCWAYAGVGAVEALINLFFNEHYSESQPTYHHIDLNLSEWQVVACNGRDCDPSTPIISMGDPRMALNYFRDSSVVDEACMPQEDLDRKCGEQCNDPDEIVSITKNDSIGIISDTTFTNEDWLKRCLITYGPLACSIKDYPSQGDNHVMTLVGFTSLYENDLVYLDSENPANNIVIEKDSPLIGTSSWFFKNSDGPTWGNHGFFQIGFPYSRFLTEGYMNRKIFGDIIRNGHTNAEIRCVDKDGDGYYWWGIHMDSTGNSVNPQLCNCPDSITNPDFEDCDDSDPDVGPYNLEPADGPLYECLPDCDVFSDDPYIINQDDSIKRNLHFNRNVVVNPGATLKIKNCTVSFSGQAKLVVKQGGKLVIEYATLTTKCPGVMWQGVEVWGYSGYTQNDPEHPQGKVEMVSGTIEKAKIGITTVNYEYVPDGDTMFPMPTFAGGIIQAENSDFINNIVAIEFYPYRFPNTSYFKNCSFESTSDFLEHKLPDYFLKMFGVDSVEIFSCSFINTRNTNIDSCFKWGGGIFSYNSSVVVKKLNSQTEKCKFQRLTRGIYALNSGDTKSVTVEDAEFTENYRTVYLSGMGSVNATRIVLNDIKVPAPPANIEQYPYGLYLDYCTGYKVEANTFWSTTREDPTIGLIVNNSGPEDNIIYRNTFKKLYAGIIAQNRNRNE